MPIIDEKPFGKYYLIRCNSEGQECEGDKDSRKGPAKLLSDDLAERVEEEKITDVFIMSHGWMTDEPAARHQYSGWLEAMHSSKCETDRSALNDQRAGGFKSVVVGLHWPSLPFGDEKAHVSGSADLKKAIADGVQKFASRIHNGIHATQELTKLFTSALDKEDSLNDRQVINLWQTLDKISDLPAKCVIGNPAEDREQPNYSAIWDAAQVEEKTWFDKVMRFPRGLSYWSMKRRALVTGENAGANILRKLQKSAPESTRFHLIGHSFGSIVVSGAVQGGGALVKPVNSLILMQGALSHWSFSCDESIFESKRGESGYFHKIDKEHMVNGPVVSTTSVLDLALKDLYFKAAAAEGATMIAAAGELPPIDDEPKVYGAVGYWGTRGAPLKITKYSRMLDCNEDYKFQNGTFHNIDGRNVIKEGSDESGAHCDLCHPEVAHVVYQAAMGE